MWIAYIYGLVVVITGLAAIFKGATFAGITGLIGPALCWFGGCGMYGSFAVGTAGQKIAGLVMGLACLLIGLGLLAWSGFWVTIYAVEIGGVTWGIIGFVIGLVATPRSAAEFDGQSSRRGSRVASVLDSAPVDNSRGDSREEVITERAAADAVVDGILADAKEHFPSLIQSVGEVAKGTDVSDVPETAWQFYAVAVIALEGIAATNLFPGDQGGRLRLMMHDRFGEATGLSRDIARRAINEIEVVWNDAIAVPIDPGLELAKHLYDRWDMRWSGAPENLRGSPDFIAVTVINTYVTESCGRWRRIRDNVKLIPNSSPA